MEYVIFDDGEPADYIEDLGLMHRFKYVVGIDPGVHTGLVIFSDGEMIMHHTCTPLETIEYLGTLAGNCLVVMEDSRLQSYVFTGDNLKESPRLKIARNVGMVDMLCKIYEVASGMARIIKVSPQTKGAKFSTNEKLSKAVGYKVELGSQHERDAFLLAYRYRSARDDTN